METLPYPPDDGLPPILRYPEVLKLADSVVGEVIKDILHEMSKMSLGGSSKAGKSWLVSDLALSVAHGTKWLDRFETMPFKVLYLNLEIPDVFFSRRLKIIAESRKLSYPTPGRLDVWNLRGYNRPYDELAPAIIKRIEHDGYGLVIIDPIYKLLGTADENKANDVTNLLNHLEAVSKETGAAIVFVAHFSKGNQAGKEAIDRVSGSGVFARDPDTIVTLTDHEEDDCYTIQFKQRLHKEQSSFVLEWKYPLFTVREELDPTKLKKPIAGRPTIHENSDLLDLLPMEGMTATEWQKEAISALGISPATFNRGRRTLARKKSVARQNGLWVPNRLV